MARRASKAFFRFRGMPAAWLGVFVLLSLLGQGWAGCFQAKTRPDQGMCRDLYTVKVCAANQSAADEYIQETHGVIVKANCKKALNVLCSTVGGGSATDQYEEVCCKVANHCETDEDCGDQTDPYAVKMCCSYCVEMYGLSCETAEPVHAGFMSVGSLYNSFYGTDVWTRCKEFCVETLNGTNARSPGQPCLREPDHPSVQGSESSGVRRVGGGMAALAAAAMAAVAAVHEGRRW